MASISFLMRCGLGVATALSLVGCASTPTPSCAPTRLAYVGTDSGQLQALRLDACAGKLESLGTVARLVKPRWSVANPTLPILYVADDATGSVLVSGRVEANNVDGFVSLLSIGFGVSAEGRGETETVLRK